MRSKDKITKEVAQIERDPDYIDQGENEYLFLEVLIDTRDEKVKHTKIFQDIRDQLVKYNELIVESTTLARTTVEKYQKMVDGL